MKKSKLNLSQLKADVGAKLKRKHEPLSPTSASSSKKKVAEKEVIEEEPTSTPLEKDKGSPTRKDPPTPSPSIALIEVGKGDRVEGAENLTSITPVPPSIPTPFSKEKVTEVENFCSSMKNALVDPPLVSGYGIVSRNTNYYGEEAEVGILL